MIGPLQAGPGAGAQSGEPLSVGHSGSLRRQTSHDIWKVMLKNMKHIKIQMMSVKLKYITGVIVVKLHTISVMFINTCTYH